MSSLPSTAVLLLALCLAGCSSPSKSGPPKGLTPKRYPVARHSSSIARSEDGKHVYVANADLDSVSVIDVVHHTLEKELLLGGAHPVPRADGAYLPSISPRMLALSVDGASLYVTGQRSGKLYALDLASGRVSRTVEVGAEPVGVIASADGTAVYVACSAEGTLVKVDLASFTVTAQTSVAWKPWALAWSADGKLLETSHLLGPGVTVVDAATLGNAHLWSVPDVAPQRDPRIAHGQARGLYDVVVRSGTSETWAAHMLLGTNTPQPALDFESTAFPALTRLGDTGAPLGTLSTDASDVPGIDGAFGDVVSGPRALQFTSDGAYLLSLDTFSGDVLVVDANATVESSLLRPLPGAQPEGLVLSPDEQELFIDERSSNDVAFLRVTRASAGLSLAVDGARVPRSTVDPMPPNLREGQRLFSSSDSDSFALTQDHWMSCAVCHLEGRSDAVTFRFAPGPRDTPSNAGGMLGTGFLFRTADRSRVSDYWVTINTEQGGHFDPGVPSQAAQLRAIQDYVNQAIPLPVPPWTNPARVAEGKALFERPDVGCAGCHSGPRFTDSGAGNPTLDRTQTVLLHDVGTCVTSGASVDVPHDDLDGHPREACAFDTPSLNGIADSAPYLHDGSAATLKEVLERTRGKMGNVNLLTADQEDALIEYLRSL